VHELGIAQNIVAIVSERAGKHKVCRVKLEIGQLSAIMPDAIKFCFDVCADGTCLEGAKLEIQEIPGRAKCKECLAEMELALLAATCNCGSRDLICIAGQELKIIEMEVL
jgi:hydrogenase nickel incorporation protein HypA/HybF